METRGLRPGGAIGGRIAVPGSKSIAQRAIVCAALAGGTTRMAGLPDGDDVRATLALVEACGARVQRLAPAAVALTGRPPGPERGWAPRGPVSAGESGTLARFATAALGLCGTAGRTFEVRGEGTLARRSSPPLFRALASAGVELEWSALEGGWPVRVRAIGPESTLRLVDPVSSQEVSALWIATRAWPDAIAVEVEGEIPSRPYLDLTLAVLRSFGAETRGPLVAPSEPVVVEPDASSAAVVLAAACLSGGRAEIVGLARDSRQPDARVLEHLARFGCRTGEFSAEGEPTRGAEVDLGDSPDLAPVLAIVAAHAARNGGGASRLIGLRTLVGKESPRVDVLARALASIGLEVESGPDFLAIGPGRDAGAPVLLDPRGDHRMAFAFALLGLVREGVRVQDGGCVAKSWPGFWEKLERHGARIAEAG